MLTWRSEIKALGQQQLGSFASRGLRILMSSPQCLFLRSHRCDPGGKPVPKIRLWMRVPRIPMVLSQIIS